MSYLLYAIVHGDRAEPDPPARFPGYPRASIMIRAGRLGGVASALGRGDAAPDVARLLVYSRVIEAYNRERAVIPMRYGCRFSSIAGIGSFLERKRQVFAPLLDELDGCVEMSLRVIIGEPCDPATAPAAACGGKQYLSERRRLYDALDAEHSRGEEIHEWARAMAAGTFSRSLAEASRSDGKSVCSIHFLVRRERIPNLRRKLEPLTSAQEFSALVTGPWPAYNFVGPRSRERIRP